MMAMSVQCSMRLILTKEKEHMPHHYTEKEQNVAGYTKRLLYKSKLTGTSSSSFFTIYIRIYPCTLQFIHRVTNLMPLMF